MITFYFSCVWMLAFNQTISVNYPRTKGMGYTTWQYTALSMVVTGLMAGLKLGRMALSRTTRRYPQCACFNHRWFCHQKEKPTQTSSVKEGGWKDTGDSHEIWDQYPVHPSSQFLTENDHFLLFKLAFPATVGSASLLGLTWAWFWLPAADLALLFAIVMVNFICQLV